MDFGDALQALRQGCVVKRAGWNVTLGIVKHPPLEPDGRLSIIYPDGTYTPFGKLDADLLALDWEVAGEYSPFGRRDPRDRMLTKADVTLLQGEPVPLCPDCLCPAENAVVVMRLEAA